ncbi:MAG: MBL fold metallo-hydrolase [Aquabacterium sp.]|uniref:MBL fold metallo-hydrolase n=1 Tax=Aquabacterium sp. TaxID=1872578 RepID=UPI00271DF1E3|nr:MBL fold metallo-hydrolase [Aquabacterium sp.]MDO9003979.1 MBL fold metallo-hydrolase [Aquabacterium sp.]
MKGAKLISATGRQLTRMGARPLFDEGLYELGRDSYAWLVPNGSWGETNIGLVRCGDQTVLIDTCWDLPHTREMLGHADQFLRDAPVHAIINTHADGDHCWGNQLFAGRPIYSTRACADQIHHHKPIQLTALQWSSKIFSGIPTNGVDALGRYMGAMLKPYRFSGIKVLGASQTFSGEMPLEIGNVKFHLLELGPGHTDGDCIVHIPERRILFAGDLLFVGVTPVAWAGPVSNIIKALKRIQAFDVDVIVPGHGPLATQEDVQQQIDYWEWLQSELAPLAAKGVNVDEAAQLCLSSMGFRNAPFAKWADTERLFTSACTLYREWGIETAKYRGPLGQLDHFRRQALLGSVTVGPESATDTFESPRKRP